MKFSKRFPDGVYRRRQLRLQEEFDHAQAASSQGDASEARVGVAFHVSGQTTKPTKPTNPFLTAPATDTFAPSGSLGWLPPVRPPPRRTAQTAVLSHRVQPSFIEAHASRKTESFPPTSLRVASRDFPDAYAAHYGELRSRPNYRGEGFDRDAVLSSLSSTTAPVRAIAVAHEQSNAVGTVDLFCCDAGLAVHFVRISSYTDGYVPYPTTSRQQVLVPYDKIAQVRVDRDGLVHLVIDPSCTPYHRLVLAGLVRDHKVDHVSSHRLRMRVAHRTTLVALVAWIPIAMVLRWTAPNLSAIIVMATAACVSLALHWMRQEIATRWVLFNASTQQLRDQLIAELRYRLAPGKVELASDDAALVDNSKDSDIEGKWARHADSPEASLRGLFVTVGVVAAAAVLAILIGKNLLFSSSQNEQAWGSDLQEAWGFLESRSTGAPTGILSSEASTMVADPTPLVEPAPPCACERSDSPLWSDGVPRMSIISTNRPGTTSPERPSVYPEIAIVNNASTDLKDIVMVVDFLYSGGPDQKPRVVDKQDLFWEGVLAPGKAVKWRVRGRGDDFRVNSFIKGQLGQDMLEPAPADAFYKLVMTANTPSVRLHGAKMLAYLGDSRVTEGIEKLRQEHREEMTSTIDQIAQATRALRVCHTTVEPADQTSKLRVTACVFNAGATIARKPLVTAQVVREGEGVESRWSLPEDLAPNTGVVTKGIVVNPSDTVDLATTLVNMTAE